MDEKVKVGRLTKNTTQPSGYSCTNIPKTHQIIIDCGYPVVVVEDSVVRTIGELGGGLVARRQPPIMQRYSLGSGWQNATGIVKDGRTSEQERGP